MKENKTNVLFRVRSMEVGGVQKVLLNILKNINRDKFTLYLLLNLNQGELLREIPSDVKVFSIGKGKENMSENKYIKYLQLIIRRIKLYYFDFFPTQIKFFLLKSRKIDIDVAFIDNLVDCLERTKEPGVKKIGWIHGDLTKASYNLQKKEFIVNQFMKLDKMIYVSHNTLSSTQTINKEAGQNAKVVHNPIDVNEIIEKSKEKKPEVISSVFKDGIFSFIFVGRVYGSKGCKLLFDAHKELMDRGVNHKVYLVGEGYQTAELKGLARENNLETSFLLLGEKENPYTYISSADVLVLPSYSEGYPLVVAEALILEKPILCTNVGGIKEMMENGINGLFIEYTKDSLTEGMKKMIQDKELFNRIKMNNQKCKENFNPNKIYREIENLFLEKK